jgi:hypothetical protein
MENATGNDTTTLYRVIVFNERVINDKIVQTNVSGVPYVGYNPADAAKAYWLSIASDAEGDSSFGNNRRTEIQSIDPKKIIEAVKSA